MEFEAPVEPQASTESMDAPTETVAPVAVLPAGRRTRPVFDVLVRDPLRAAVEAESDGRATVLYDVAGHPNHMHVLARQTYADLGFERQLGRGNVSAFEVGGVVKSELFIGVYQSSERNGLGCSLPAGRPWMNLTYDEAVAASTAKGPGWHMMSAHEWAAVAFGCMANGYQPRGNVANGNAGGRFRNETGSGYDNAQHIGRTGTGPHSWRHDGLPGGIADLVGNALEWNSLIKLVDGQVLATPDNDYTAAEADWVAQGCYLDCSRKKITLTHSAVRGANTAYSVAFSRFRRARRYQGNLLLRRLLMEPAGIVPQGRMYVKDHGERMVSRGGEPETGGGLAAAFIYDPRDSRQPDVGFRIAYIA